MKKLINVIKLGLAMTLICSLVACGGKATTGTGSSQESKEDDTIQLGLIAPITGPHAEYGKGFDAATQIAIDEINANGGVKGKKLSIEVNDSKSEPKESADIARKYSENSNIKAIIGDFTSGCSMADAPIVDKAGITLLSPTASNPDYPTMSDYAFTLMNNQASEAPWFGKALVGKYLNAKSASIMWLNTDWGTTTHKYLLEGLKSAGVEVKGDESYAETETDFSSVISKLKSSNADVLIVLDQGNVPTIINQIRGTGWGVQIATLGPGASESLLNQCGDNAEGLIVDTPSFLTKDNKDAVKFIDAFKNKTGFPPTDHSLCAYNAVYMLKAAIESINGDITREAIKDALKTTEIDSLAGHIKFNKDGGCDRQLMILKVENGKYVVKENFGYGVE